MMAGLSPIPESAGGSLLRRYSATKISLPYNEDSMNNSKWEHCSSAKTAESETLLNKVYEMSSSSSRVFPPAHENGVVSSADFTAVLSCSFKESSLNNDENVKENFGVMNEYDKNSAADTNLATETNSTADSNPAADNNCLIEKLNSSKTDNDYSKADFFGQRSADLHNVREISLNSNGDELKEDELSDGETFEGKIVYNPDGSAYIIEGDSENTDSDSILQLPEQEGAIVELKDKVIASTTILSYPQIASAIYIRCPPSGYSSICSRPRNLWSNTDAPIMHSYRVYDLRLAGKNKDSRSLKDDTLKQNLPQSDQKSTQGRLDMPSPGEVMSVPMKPILMCFICKLSFGFVKSFILHASAEHDMKLNDDERAAISSQNASALIQGVGHNKAPLMSFLEPITTTPVDVPGRSGSPNPVPWSMTSTNVSYVYAKPHSSMFHHTKQDSKLNFKTPKVHNGLDMPASISTIPPGFAKKVSPETPKKPDFPFPLDKNSDSQLCDFSFFNASSSAWRRTSSASELSVEKNNNSINNSVSDSRHSYSFTSSGFGTMACNSAMDSGKLLTSRPESPSLQSSPSVTSQSMLLTIPSYLLPSSSSQSGFIPSAISNQIIEAGKNDCSTMEHTMHGGSMSEYSRCDLFPGQERSPSGQSISLHTRNSCKTLKCPKCNWHYKYQETLEIHMKEKHPESEAQCAYCISGQPHPRLARGESYTCGYKPYRCDICNYSTTTKGNLSIHLQSDKHTNNMQELQNGGPEVKLPPTPPLVPTTSVVGTSNVGNVTRKGKSKATWRCNFCSYETTEARNLRIHMTSEKHAHNLMALQQNMRHMQQMALFGQDPTSSLLGLPSMIGLSAPPPPSPFDSTSVFMPQFLPNMAETAMDLTKQTIPLPPDLTDPTVELHGNGKTDNESGMFQCTICRIFSSDSLDALQQHIQLDRSKSNEQESVTVIAGTYLCNLCQYKTGLKANFQLHCKTDKHLQRLQLINHIQEGIGSGSASAVELGQKLMNTGSPVQVSCIACNYSTNSIYRLQMHVSGQAHEVNARLFCHLQAEEALIRPNAGKVYRCELCDFSSLTKTEMIQHSQTEQHHEMENQFLHSLIESDERGRQHSGLEHFYVEQETSSSRASSCDSDEEVCSEAQDDMEATEFNGIETQLEENRYQDQPLVRKQTSSNFTKVPEYEDGHLSPQLQHVKPQSISNISCILCMESIGQRAELENHLLQVHKVKVETLHSILQLVDSASEPSDATSHHPAKQDDSKPGQSEPVRHDAPSSHASTMEVDEEPHQSTTPDQSTQLLRNEALRLAEEASSEAILLSDRDQDEPECRCQICGRTFTEVDSLYAHQNELGHLELKQTSSGPGYVCWQRGCMEYFKTANAVQLHHREVHAQQQKMSISERHEYKFRCNQCSLAFKTVDRLQAHSYYHVIRSATECFVCNQTFRSVESLKKHVDSNHIETMDSGQLERYHAKLAAASSLALLGASGIDSFVFCKQNQKADPHSSSSTLAKIQESTLNNPENHSSCNPDKQDVNNVSRLMKLDENSNTSGLDGLEESNLSKTPNCDDDLAQLNIDGGGVNYSLNKYKCHRCKVGFPKMSYLSAHNKTLMHRQGSKMNHPLDKYFDPNRPYKCEVCLESFTQKNILLVHYNSVSHLHKLKQQTPSQEKEIGEEKCDRQKNEDSDRRFDCSIPLTSSSGTDRRSDNYVAMTSSSGGFQMVESESNRYCCSGAFRNADADAGAHALNPSYVAAMTIENTSKSLSASSDIMMKDVSDMVSHVHPPLKLKHDESLKKSADTSVPSTMNTASSISAELNRRSPAFNPTYPVSIPSVSMPLVSMATVSKPSDVAMHLVSSVQSISEAQVLKPAIASCNSVTAVRTNAYACHKCNAVFGSLDYLTQHQQIMHSTSSVFSQIPVSKNTFTSPLRQETCTSSKSQVVYHSLVQNFGFECAMQFNEFRQKNKKPSEENKTDTDKTAADGSTDPSNESSSNVEESKKKDRWNDLPELSMKSTCNVCAKEFSSIWVLKSHEEEVHKKLLPLKSVSEFGRIFRKLYERRHSKSSSTVVSTTLTSVTLPEVKPSVEPAKLSSSGCRRFESSCSQQVVTSQKQQQQQQPSSSDEQRMLRGSNNLSAELAAAQAAQMMQLPFLMGLNMLPPPPLMSMMMPLGAELFGMSAFPMIDPLMMLSQQQQQQQQQHQQHPVPISVPSGGSTSNIQQQKPARTRITDDQLSVLRAHFDINNSPSDEQIHQMSEKTGLLPKVIKHWFRNTLFKERQRNKDSPYNFNVPPSTTLNLEEYEKTSHSTPKKEPTEQVATNEQRPVSQNKPSSNISRTTPSDPSKSFLNEFRSQNMKELEQLPPFMQTNATNLNKMAFHVPMIGPTTAGCDMSPAVLSSLMQMSPMYMPPSLLQGIDPGSNMVVSTQSSIGASGASCGSSSQERRANRTRFTKHQIRILQDFFEQNAYPKDDELESLSKLLDLSPRVIVVWFQNARQKVRKTFENQPPVDMSEDGHPASQIGTNYQCKKCQMTFASCNELIKHQRAICYKEDENCQMSVSNSTHSEEVSDDDDGDNDGDDDGGVNGSQSSGGGSELKTSSMYSENLSGIEYRCEKCNLTFVRLEKWKEHQAIHAAGLGLTLPQNSSSSVVTCGNVFDRVSSLDAGLFSSDGQDESQISKHWSEDGDDKDDQPRDKRIRTTILPEQLDYLYHKYQSDCNPSRKQLDAIASRVGLKKRVVQVWFQNTRARERKGQYRAHQQLIHKRCPFCKALFRAKSALEAHLTTKHPEDCAHGEINIDNIPDEPTETVQINSPVAISSPSNLTRAVSSSSYGIPNPFMSVVSSSRAVSSTDLLQANMQRYYEDSYKKYIDELSHASHMSKPELVTVRHDSTSTPVKVKQDEGPLDLSTSFRNDNECSKGFDFGVSTQDDSESDNDFSMIEGESAPASPGSSTSNQSKQTLGMPGKRYRTQMTSLQIKVMKSIFVDYKTPTMSECEVLGHEISLPKRVVQVWFQNARAKEKKCSPAFPEVNGGSGNNGAVVNPQREDCAICGIRYSLQQSIQDHLFTRRHIDRVKSLLRSHKDVANMQGSGDGNSSAPPAGHQSFEFRNIEKRAKLSSSTSTSPPNTNVKQEQIETLNGSTPSCVNENKVGSGALSGFFPNHLVGAGADNTSAAANAQLLSSFGRIPMPNPTDMMGMMPYFYPGLTGFYPGVGMPFMPPTVMPGLESMFMYDPVNYGTPLMMLQIPPASIQKIQEKASDVNCKLTNYTQDCRSFSDLKKYVSSEDWSVACRATLDVGYICKKCHVVFPGRSACTAHQQAVCCHGTNNAAEFDAAVLKLEQLMYECSACQVRCSTISEYVMHCSQNNHKMAVGQNQRPPSSTSSAAKASAAESTASNDLPVNCNNEDNMIKTEFK